MVIADAIFGTILSGYFSAQKVKNARKYIQYCLRFLPLPDEKLSR